MTPIPIMLNLDRCGEGTPDLYFLTDPPDWLVEIDGVYLGQWVGSDDPSPEQKANHERRQELCLRVYTATCENAKYLDEDADPELAQAWVKHKVGTEFTPPRSTARYSVRVVRTGILP